MDATMFPEYQHLIEERIRSGRNHDTMDMIREALELLEIADREGMPTQREITEACEDVAAGRCHQWSSEYGERLMREAQEQVRNRRQAHGPIADC